MFKMKQVVILLMLMCLSVMAAMPGVKTTLVNKQAYYRIADMAQYYRMKCVQKGNKIELSLPDGRTMAFTTNKTETKLFGVTVHLSYPVEKDMTGLYCISKSDYDTLLSPILHPSSVPRRNVSRIMLDAGHGGKDRGAERGSVMEKNLTLVVARRVAAILRKRGYEVLMTRDADKQLELKSRSNAVNAQKPDLLVSIHFNAHASPGIRGIEVYVPNPANTPSFLGAKGAVSASNKFDRENALLGFLMQRRLLSSTKAADRGFKRVQHYVTRNVACPAVLVELGFITNPTECALFAKSDYLDKLALGICDAVQEFGATLDPKK